MPAAWRLVMRNWCWTKRVAAVSLGILAVWVVFVVVVRVVNVPVAGVQPEGVPNE